MPYKVGDKIVYQLGELREELPVRYLKENEVQDYAALIAECAAKNKQWEDPEFDPFDKNYDIIGKAVDGFELFTDKKGKKTKQTWLRIKELDPKAVFAKPDKDGNLYNRSDLSQGRVGDCFYLAALNIVVGKPGLINFIIPEDNEEGGKWGIYHFRFWWHGYWYDIIVDDRVPTHKQMATAMDENFRAYQKEVTIASGAEAHDHEFWPMLIEKAFAKLYGCYGFIDGGQTDEALEHFTGGFVLSIKLNEVKNFSEQWKWMAPTDKYETLLGLSGRPKIGKPEVDNKADPVSGLFRGHAYAVVGREEIVDKSGQTLRLLRVKNPHGKNEWKLDWSDKSSKWDTLEPEDKKRLWVDKNDGEFWISFEDATNLNNFSQFSACIFTNNFEQLSKTTKIIDWVTAHGNWKKRGTRGDIIDAVSNSPQYLLTTKSSSSETISLGTTLVVKGNRKAVRDEKVSGGVQLYIWKVDPSLLEKKLPYSAEHFGKMKQVTLESSKMKRSSENTKGMFSFVQVEVGSYLIVPTKKNGEAGNFLLRVMCQDENPDGTMRQETTFTASEPDDIVKEDEGTLKYYRGWEKEGFLNPYWIK